MPDFFKSRFPARAGRIADMALRAQERWSIRVASAVLTVNDALLDRLVALGVPREKVTVILNTPDLARFDPALHAPRPFMADGVLRLVYAGALTPTYELDVVLDAIAAMAAARPDLAVAAAFYGRGDAESMLRDAARRKSPIASHSRADPLEAVPAAVAAADIGLAPTRRSEMTDQPLSQAAGARPWTNRSSPRPCRRAGTRARDGGLGGRVTATIWRPSSSALSTTRPSGAPAGRRPLPASSNSGGPSGGKVPEVIERLAPDGLSSAGPHHCCQRRIVNEVASPLLRATGASPSSGWVTSACPGHRLRRGGTDVVGIDSASPGGSSTPGTAPSRTSPTSACAPRWRQDSWRWRRTRSGSRPPTPSSSAFLPR
jgi:hypothetical protein